MRVHGLARTISFSLGCLLGISCSSVFADSASDETGHGVNDTIPFSLAISGGISLGSYESGLNWALVKYLKTRRNEITLSEPGNSLPS